MFRSRVFPISVAVWLAGAASAGVVAGQTIPALTEATKTALIDSAAARLERIYVEADTGKLIADRLRQRLAAGAYRGTDNPAQFAELVTRDLRGINGDLHLSLRYAPEPPPAPGGRPAPQSVNFGLGRAEVLDGNVGYLEITGFVGAEGYQDVVADALRFLARTDALIVDVRRNGGGSGEMSHLVFSHFLGAEPVSTIVVKRRAPAEPVLRRSVATVPGPRRTDVPLYVLTSQNTASAAEEFSFVLKNQRRATIVGSRTAGAGHMVTGAPIGAGFVLNLSITRVSDPITGKEWEGVGVQPDLAVAPEQALTAAHRAALQTIAATTADPARARTLRRLIAALGARLEPIPVDPARIQGWVGNYEGRVVSAADGRLRLTRREGGLSEELIPLGDDRFALGATQYRFGSSNGKPALTIEPPDGTSVTLVRGAAPNP